MCAGLVEQATRFELSKLIQHYKICGNDVDAIDDDKGHDALVPTD